MTINDQSISWFERSDHLAQLISKYRSKELVEAERKVLDEWLDSDPENRNWFEELMSRDFPTIEDTSAYGRYDPEKVLEDTWRKIRKRHTVKRLRVGGRYLAAAGLVGLITWGAINVWDVRKSPTTTATTTQKEEPATFEKIITLRGNERRLMLEDGSEARMNGASTFSYPTTFAPDRRQVEMTGEIYFEAKTEPARPFTVVVGNTMIEAVGTKFNVNAYNDNGFIRVSLIEGKLRISTGNQKDSIRSGQAAEIVPGKSIRIIDNINTEEARGWMDGYFVLDNANSVAIMSEIGRRYKVDVQFDAKPHVPLKGHLYFNVPLDTLLKGLNGQGIRNKIENGRIVVY